jgi:hypothetical protein
VDGYEFQLADLAWDEEAQEYVSHFEATVEGAGTSGVGYQELQNAQVFALGQNFPNPVGSFTEIPLEMLEAGEVVWSLWSPSGACVSRTSVGMMPPGRHVLAVDFAALGVPAASYLYHVEVSTARGRFTEVKRMTVAK